jgi:hypothetical protein
MASGSVAQDGEAWVADRTAQYQFVLEHVRAERRQHMDVLVEQHLMLLEGAIAAANGFDVFVEV